MPRPPGGGPLPETQQVLDQVVQMSEELLQEFRSAQRETLEQQRSLIQDQQASLQQMLNQALSAGTMSWNGSVVPAEQTPEAELKAQNPNEQKVVGDEQGCQTGLQVAQITDTENTDIPVSPKFGDSTVVGVQGVTGRGATWIADQDRTTMQFKFDPRDLHYETGVCVTIVDAQSFHAISMVMIFANAVYLGVEADWNSSNTLSDADWGFQLCEQMFCSFFTIELLIRFGAFRHKLDCRRDRWFVLDLFMVVLMVFETWIFPALSSLSSSGSEAGTGPIGGIGRMLRLLRLARITKLMQMMPELVTMVKGMIAALRAVHAALLILILLVYVFAIVMNALIGHEIETKEFFGTVRDSMVTLLVQGVLLDDISGLVRELIVVKNVAAMTVFGFFVLLSALTVINMLIGVLCEVVVDVSAEEKEAAAKEKMKKTLLVMLQELDADNSGQLSKSEVQSVICHPEAVAIMNDIQVDTQYLLDISEMLFVNEDSSLPISVFMNIVLTLRGKRPPTMNDIAKGHNLSMWAIETQLTHHRALMTKALKEIHHTVRRNSKSPKDLKNVVIGEN